ncbi:MAG: dockerin type I domain-containing protein [Ruminococcus callidus]
MIFGDVNLDGKVDISDAVLLNKTVAGTISLSKSAQKMPTATVTEKPAAMMQLCCCGF